MIKFVDFKLGLTIYIVSEEFIYFFALMIKVCIHYAEIAEDEVLASLHPQLSVSEDSIKVVIDHRPMDLAFLIIEQGIGFVIVERYY